MKVHIYSGSVGTKTGWQGYDWGIDCFFPNSIEGVPDNTSLSIEAGHLTTQPIINASLSWPAPRQVFSEYQPATDEVIEWIASKMPKLSEQLRKSLSEADPALRTAPTESVPAGMVQ